MKKILFVLVLSILLGTPLAWGSSGELSNSTLSTRTCSTSEKKHAINYFLANKPDYKVNPSAVKKCSIDSDGVIVPFYTEYRINIGGEVGFEEPILWSLSLYYILWIALCFGLLQLLMHALKTYRKPQIQNTTSTQPNNSTASSYLKKDHSFTKPKVLSSIGLTVSILLTLWIHSAPGSCDGIGCIVLLPIYAGILIIPSLIVALFSASTSNLKSQFISSILAQLVLSTFFHLFKLFLIFEAEGTVEVLGSVIILTTISLIGFFIGKAIRWVAIQIWKYSN